MPGLKTLVSTFKLKPDRNEEDFDGSAAACSLKRVNAKLYKRNRSILDVGVCDNDSEERLPRDSLIKQGFLQRLKRNPAQDSPVSRTGSFEIGQSVEDFDAELRASAALRNERRNGMISRFQPNTASPDEVLVSKHGLNINTTNLDARQRSAKLSPSTDIAPVGEPGLRPHSHNLELVGSAAVQAEDDPLPFANLDSSSSEANQRPHSAPPGTNPYLNAAQSRENEAWPYSNAHMEKWRATMEQRYPDPTLGIMAKKTNPYRRKIPAIRDLDWNKIGEDELREIVDAYNNVSPTDSAIAYPEKPTYSGKGKGRADQSNESLDELVVLGDFHVAAQVALEAEAERQQREEEARLREEEAKRLRMEEEIRLQALAMQEQLRRAQEEEERLAAERARLRECAVCGDSKDPLEFPTTAATAKCEHPPQTCKECVESWMASEFDTKGTEGIICPECPEILQYDDVQRAASAATFEAFDKVATRNALASLDEFAWCLAPNCKSGQLNVDNNQFMDCISCGYKQCLRHKCAWHTAESCEQYEYRTSGQKSRDEELASELEVKKISKKCPGKGCGWHIEKTTGCDHMTCRRCKHQFCWQCLAPQSEIKRVGNTAHERWCKFHSANLDVAWPFNMH